MPKYPIYHASLIDSLTLYSHIATACPIVGFAQGRVNILPGIWNKSLQPRGLCGFNWFNYIVLIRVAVWKQLDITLHCNFEMYEERI
jgi:hypothetical protein